MHTVTRWDDAGRPAEWVTEVEAEFDANERDSWYALAEHEQAICPHCGNYRAICSTPGGLGGDGYHIREDVCYASAARDATLRRISKKFAKSQPDLQGSLPTDGVSIAVTLTPDDSEDVLGLGEKSDAERLFAEKSPRNEHEPNTASHE